MFTFSDNLIYIPEADLYLDSRKKRNFGFVSHAHSDHLKKHATILCTPQTADLAKVRVKNSRFEVLPYFTRKKINRVNITLLPAGHIMGSAQILLENENTSLIYTGDFKPNASRTAEKLVYKTCDILIMESTFGKPEYVFPPKKDTEDLFIQKLREKLSAGITPVVYVYPLGKGQEILHLISSKNLPVAAEYSILKFTRVYEKFGIKFGAYDKFRKSDHAGQILLLSTGRRYEKLFRENPSYYTYYISGWGAVSNAQKRFGVDEVIPISDHADFNELIDFVEKVRPKKIYCTHGNEDFYKVLRSKGFDAFSLKNPYQAELF